MEKISVILPYYHNGDTIERCINSILDQTYGYFELLCVSDGADEKTTAAVQRLALMDSRIVPLSVPHGGVSRARNEGLAQADGGYIQFVDADDCLEPDMFATMLAALKREGADICVCAFDHPCLGEYAGDRVFDMRDTEEIYAYYQHTFAGHVPWNKLYRREVIKTPFIEGMKFCEDGMFGIANMFNAKKIVSVSDILYHYCVAAPDAAEKSCIAEMACAPFWESRDTIWYQRRALMPIADEIFRAHLSAQDAARFGTVRLFDFFLWEMLIYAGNGAPDRGLRIEMERVLAEPDFVRSVTDKARFGVLRRQWSSRQVTLFIDGLRAFYDAPQGLRPYFAASCLFAALFLRAGDTLDENDLAAASLAALQTEGTPEARFVSAFLEKKVLERGA